LFEHLTKKGAVMADEKLLILLEQGAPAWNRWRADNPDQVSPDLRGANLSGYDLTAINFQGADLENADLSNTKLCNANLEDATLHNTSLRGADVTGAIMSKSVLGADFWETKGLSKETKTHIKHLLDLSWKSA